MKTAFKKQRTNYSQIHLIFLS